MKNKFVVRYSDSTIASIGLCTVLYLVSWLCYWLTLYEFNFFGFIITLLLIFPLILIFLYYISWKVCVSNNRIIVCRLFRKKKEYQLSQVHKIIGYSSGAERGDIIWLYFPNNVRVKVSHSMKNYSKFHYYLVQRGTIEWK